MMNLRASFNESSCVAWWVILCGLMGLPVWLDESSCLTWWVFLPGLMSHTAWFDKSFSLVLWVFLPGLMSVPFGLMSSCLAWWVFLPGLVSLPAWFGESSCLAWWVLAGWAEAWWWSVTWRLMEGSCGGLQWWNSSEVPAQSYWLKGLETSVTRMCRKHWSYSLKREALGIFLVHLGSTRIYNHCWR